MQETTHTLVRARLGCCVGGSPSAAGFVDEITKLVDRGAKASGHVPPPYGAQALCRPQVRQAAGQNYSGRLESKGKGLPDRVCDHATAVRVVRVALGDASGELSRWQHVLGHQVVAIEPGPLC